MATLTPEQRELLQRHISIDNNGNPVSNHADVRLLQDSGDEYEIYIRGKRFSITEEDLRRVIRESSSISGDRPGAPPTDEHIVSPSLPPDSETKASERRRQIFFFAASSAEAQDNFTTLIAEGIELSNVLSLVDAETEKILRQTYSNRCYLWGARGGNRNIKTWEQMTGGDLVLSYSEGEIVAAAWVITKVKNKKLAEVVWGEDRQGNLFPLIYFLTAPELFSGVPYSEFEELFGEGPVRGFRNVSQEKADSLLDKYETPERFVELELRSRSPQVTGYNADSPQGPDQLGIDKEVNAFSAVIASNDLKPPLCLGLFGDWGSGKTFFMRSMEKRIGYLAKQAEIAENTSYCSKILQIGFNAWHYTDANLLACLTNEIFQSLKSYFKENVEERKIEAAKAARKQAQEALEISRKKAFEDAFRSQYSVPEDIFRESRTLDEIQRKLKGIILPLRIIIFRPNTWVPLIATALAIFLGFNLLQQVLEDAFPGQPATLDFVESAVNTITSTIKMVAIFSTGLIQLWKPVTDFRSTVKQTAKETENAKEVQEARKKLKDAEETLNNAKAEIEPFSQDLIDFILAKSENDDYRKHLGVVSMIRRDFHTLEDQLKGKVERIVLYIDDLDRCSNEVVVEVLQAVHRLLAFPLFVVVVGVDSRWLLRSLEESYPALRVNAGNNGSWSEDEIWAWQSTPQSYLEKMFQIPYNLRPMNKPGFTRLVNSILVPPVQANPKQSISNDTNEKVKEPDKVSGTSDSSPQPKKPSSDEKLEINPNPKTLEITEMEREFINYLSPLIFTPRSTKRFINIYRLIRATVLEKDLYTFLGSDERPGEFRAAMVLLAILTGYPRQAPYIFKDFLSMSSKTGWNSALIRLIPNQVPDRIPSRYRNKVVDVDFTVAEAHQWRRLVQALQHISNNAPLPSTLAPYIEWIPLTSRFSFRVGKVASSIPVAQSVLIIEVQRTKAEPDGERAYVKLRNLGASVQTIQGWTLHDEHGGTMTIPHYELQSDTEVTVHAGNGENSETDLYCDTDTFGEDCKVVELHDKNDALVSKYTLPSTD